MLKDIVTIFYEPLAKVYKAANIADSLGDLQVFINDLIKTVELAEDGKLLPLAFVATIADLSPSKPTSPTLSAPSRSSSTSLPVTKTASTTLSIKSTPRARVFSTTS